MGERRSASGGRVVRAALVATIGFAGFCAEAADYRSTANQPTVLYDGPSAKARPQFLYGRDVPVEVLVTLEGWAKIRDAGGTIGWIERKSLADKRMLVVRASHADIRASAEESAPIVFRAERDVLLEVAEAASSSSTTATPGWVKVKHRDGASGYVRITQVFGL